MTTQQPSLLATDQDLLQLLADDPRQTPSMLLADTESTDSKQYVQNRLKHLLDHDLVTRPDRGIYELTGRGKRAAESLDQYNTDRERFWAIVESDS